jgi:Acid Phosphatase
VNPKTLHQREENDVGGDSEISPDLMCPDRCGFALWTTCYNRSYALRDIIRRQQLGLDIRAAVASRTDEPEWAQICLESLAIDVNVSDEADDTNSNLPDSHGGLTNNTCQQESRLMSLLECFGSSQDLIEIHYGDKTGHITRLQKRTGIPFSEMAFFDNERWNIQTVSRSLPQVKCYYTPDGMTRAVWDTALADFGVLPVE